jgi:hypothetical protein
MQTKGEEKKIQEEEGNMGEVGKKEGFRKK